MSAPAKLMLRQGSQILLLTDERTAMLAANSYSACDSTKLRSFIFLQFHMHCPALSLSPYSWLDINNNKEQIEGSQIVNLTII